MKITVVVVVAGVVASYGYCSNSGGSFSSSSVGKTCSGDGSSPGDGDGHGG